MCIVAAATVGAEPDEQPNPLQEFADVFGGTWEFEWTPAKDHEKGSWKAGDKVLVRMRNSWDLEQAALGFEFGATLPRTKKQVTWTKGFYAWNPETERATLYSFGVDGHIGRGTFYKEGDVWLSEGWIVNRDGEKKTTETRIEIRDNGNTQIHHRAVEGEPKITATWKRTSGAEE